MRHAARAAMRKHDSILEHIYLQNTRGVQALASAERRSAQVCLPKRNANAHANTRRVRRGATASVYWSNFINLPPAAVCGLPSG